MCGEDSRNGPGGQNKEGGGVKKKEKTVDFWKSPLVPEKCRTMARAGGF